MVFAWVVLLSAGALSTAPAGLRDSLSRIGLRGRQLERLASQPTTAHQLRVFECSLSELDASGVPARTVAEILRRQPRMLSALCAQRPAPFLRALHTKLDIAEPLHLIEAEPRLLTLDASRLDDAIAYLTTYLGGVDRIGEFVRAQPHALLWRDDASTPIARLLSELGMREEAIRRAQADFPAMVQLSSSANAERTLRFLEAEASLTPPQLCRLVGAFPQLLGLSLEANVKPTLVFLKETGWNPSTPIHPNPFHPDPFHPDPSTLTPPP